MKRIIKSIAIVAAIAGLAACSKSEVIGNIEEEPQTAKVSLTATLESTKVTYSENQSMGLHPSWELGDKVIGVYDDNKTFTLTVTKINDGKATLSGDDVPLSAEVCLIYKYGIKADDWKSGSMAVDYTGQAGDRTMPALMFSSGTISDGKGSFSFTNAGSVIGIDNAAALPAGASIKKVVVSGSNLSGATVTRSGNALSLTATQIAKDEISASVSGITVGSEAGKLSERITIAIPAGSVVKNVALFVDDADNSVYDYTLAAAKNIVANKYLYITDQTFNKRNNHYFSVADDKMVLFSAGNLICTRTGSAGNWNYSFSLEEYQWNYRFADISGISYLNMYGEECDISYCPNVKKDSNTSGLFQWIVSGKVDDDDANKSLGAFSVIPNADLGGNNSESVDFSQALGNGWRILSSDEWKYLLSERTILGTARYRWTTINGISGIIIFYDSYTGQTDNLTSIPEDCAFLPVTIRREGNVCWLKNNVDGWYWSSTGARKYEVNTYVETLYFDKDGVDLSFPGISRSAGLNVRLVKDVVE